MKTTLRLQNIKCEGCANTLINKLNVLENVEVENVAIDQGTVSVVYPTETTLPIIKSRLASLGYPEVTDSNSAFTQAKSFVSCAIGRISKTS